MYVTPSSCIMCGCNDAAGHGLYVPVFCCRNPGPDCLLGKDRDSVTTTTTSPSSASQQRDADFISNSRCRRCNITNVRGRNTIECGRRAELSRTSYGQDLGRKCVVSEEGGRPVTCFLCRKTGQYYLPAGHSTIRQCLTYNT